MGIWIVVALVCWCVVSIVAGLTVGRMVRARDGDAVTTATATAATASPLPGLDVA